MRNFIILMALLAFLAVQIPVHAQLKEDAKQPNISGILNNPYQGLASGLLDPSKLQMNHSVSMSFGSFGGQGLMLSTYMNTMHYQITDKMHLRTDLGIMSSPYNTFGEGFSLNEPQFFGGAQLDYQINDKTSLMLRIDNMPYYQYRPTIGGSFGSYRQNPFNY